MIDYSLILSTNYKYNKWVCNGIDYNGINWYDESLKPTKEELDSQWEEIKLIYKKEQCKSESKKRIANSDWSVLPDVNISNKSEFESYRTQLRNLIINPVEDPIFPVEPNPIWSNIK